MRTVRHFANHNLELEVIWVSDWSEPKHGSTPAVCRLLEVCGWCKEVCTCAEEDRTPSFVWYGGEINAEGDTLFYVNMYSDEFTARAYANSLVR